MEKIVRISLNGWNVWATRFVYAPTWTWDTVPGAAYYEVQLATEYGKAKGYRTDEPRFDMAPVWDQLPHGPIDMLILGFDAEGREICVSLHKRFYKVPGFDGRRQEPLDWIGAVRRNIAYLLAPARDEVADYEKGLPRSCWSCREDSITGQRSHIAYPALHHPSFIFAFLLFCKRFPDDPMVPEARRQAKVYGDWLLEHRLPKEWVCSLFPFSTIENGRFEGGIEGKNITLVRAARVGEAMIRLYQDFGDRAYLEYARHLADILVELQRDDGSWPCRVNPEDGSIVEAYTSDAISPARLFEMLEEIKPNEKYAEARHKALRWIMENPVKTRLWQGSYEDVQERPPYSNLQHVDTNETIRYLIRHRSENDRFVQIAEELNRYVEDQFVIWQDETSPIVVRCPTPTVLEQYVCYYPMEGHTGNWLLSLLALHQATRK